MNLNAHILDRFQRILFANFGKKFSFNLTAAPHLLLTMNILLAVWSEVLERFHMMIVHIFLMKIKLWLVFFGVNSNLWQCQKFAQTHLFVHMKTE